MQKSGLRTSEALGTGLGGAGIIAMVYQVWDPTMSVGAGLALGLSSLAIAAAVMFYARARSDVKKNGGGS